MNQFGAYPNAFANYYQSIFPQQQIQQVPYQYQNQQLSQATINQIQSPQYFVRQIGNIEEAKGFSVDPGCIYFFVDSANKRIYMKSMGSDGLSKFETYACQENSERQEKITPIQEINRRLAHIEDVLGGIVNDKSYADDATVREESYGNITTAIIPSNANAEPSEVPKYNGDDERKRRKWS